MEPLRPPPPTPTIKPTDLNITTTPTTATISTDKTSPVSPTSLPPPSPPPNTPTNPVPPPERIPTPPSPDSLRASASLHLRTKRAVLRRSILLKPDFKNPDGALQNVWVHRVKALDTDAEGVLRESVTTCGRRNTNFASEEEMKGRRKGRGRSGLGVEVKGLVPGGVEEGRRRVGGDWGEEMEGEDIGEEEMEEEEMEEKMEEEMEGLERTGEEGKGDGKTEAWWKFGT